MRSAKLYLFSAILFATFYPGFACTNFCMQTSQGPVFGSNLDVFYPGFGMVCVNQRGIEKTGFEPGTNGHKAQWTARFGSVTFNLAGKEWATAGINEAGLVIGSMELLNARFPVPDARPPLPIGVWAQYILDTCGSLEEVIAADAKIRIEDASAPIHFLITDSTGKSLVIEWLDSKTVIYHGSDLPVAALSNSRYAKALAIARRGGPHWWESDRGDTNKRFYIAGERCADFKTSGSNDPIRYAFDTLTGYVAAGHTKWNIVYDIRERRVIFRTTASPQVKWISLKELDFSCDGILKVQDIDTRLTGDITSKLVDYDPIENEKLFRALIGYVGIRLSDEQVRRVMEHINSFTCNGK